ncbi:MAG: glycosyltransferase family 4 protein [Planctomycetes bacterium]|nr:glycosyltransferase family 4 protein [Planctomycetota bacterium]
MAKVTSIYINARFLTEPITGIQRWAREVLVALDALISEGEIDEKLYNFILLSPTVPDDMPSYKHLRLKVCGLSRSHLWEQLELPFIARGFLINFKNTAPMFKRNMSMQIMDLQPFARSNTHSPLFNFLYKAIVPRAARSAKILQCLSDNTAREIEKHIGISSDKCVVTESGHEHILRFANDDSVLEQHQLTRGDYLLAVSSLNPNKNFAAILRAIEISGINKKLVIAGGTNPRVFRKQGSAKLPDNAIYVGRVSDEQLCSLYKNARGFIYPSFYEGWGLPPGEAMLLGCPVIASNTTSLPQVCGDAVLYCDPNDDHSIAEQITRLCNDDKLHNELIISGREQSKKFTWRNVALNIWRPIEKACRG